jgi:hypothetical protein
VSSAVRPPLPSGDVRAPAATPQVSLFRLYTLRVAYLILAVGLGLTIWPVVISHTSQLAATKGVMFALLAGLGAAALLGLRYPVQMLPLLLFELIWKAVYLLGFALPLWRAQQITAAAAEDIRACLMVLIFIPLIPWRYVYANYVVQRAERWR